MQDLIKKQDEVMTSVIDICLHIPFWKDYQSTFPHAWTGVKFDKNLKNSIPESPGVYAFFIKPDLANLGDNSYLIYIGKAGDDSGNDLRKRFMQYIYGLKRVKRVKLNRVLNKWKDYLYFYFSEIGQGHDVGQIEDDLLNAFVPCCNEAFSSEIREIVKVLR